MRVKLLLALLTVITSATFAQFSGNYVFMEVAHIYFSCWLPLCSDMLQSGNVMAQPSISKKVLRSLITTNGIVQ